MTFNPPTSSLPLKPEQIKEWVRPIQDPEIHMSLVDLGLIYEITLHPQDKVVLKMSLTSPSCPAGDIIVKEVKRRLLDHPQIKQAEVYLVWEPRWNPATMATDEIKDRLGLW